MKKDKLRCGWQMQICVKAICVTSSWKNGGWGCPLWPWTATGCRYQGWPFACSLWQKFPDHSRSFSVHGSRCVSGWGLEYFLENSRSRKLGFGREKTAANASRFIQCGPFRSKRSDPCSRCALTAWRRLGLHTVFVQLVKNTFLWGAPHLLLREWKA